MTSQTFLSRFPAAFRANFVNLVMDVAWWGVLNGSVLIFLPIFVTRLGASTTQIGILSAIPAAMNILLFIPAGIICQRYPLMKTNVVVAVLNRIFYLSYIVLPFFLHSSFLVWAFLTNALLMNIPGAVTGILGTAFLGESIPPDWRAYTIGIRYAALAAVTMITSLVCGQILGRVAFPLSYQIVFLIGFLGAGLSVLHLARIRTYVSLGLPGTELEVELKPLKAPGNRLRFEILAGPFGRTLGLLFFCQFALNLATSLVPVYQVRALKLTDGTISVGNAVFWIVYFLSSILVGRLSRKFPQKTISGLGIALAGVGMFIFALSFNPWIYYLNQTIGGFGWGLLNSGIVNYVLAKVPASDRPAYLTWYNLAANITLLAGAMLGPLIAGWTGLLVALLIVAGVRVVSSVALQKWG
jgi:MFS family permease